MNPVLVSFAKKAPADSVSSADLDYNFECVTLADQQGSDVPYYVEVTKEGTRIIPAQTIQVLSADGKLLEMTVVGEFKGVATLSPPTSGTHFLGAIDGVIQWIGSQNCDT